MRRLRYLQYSTVVLQNEQQIRPELETHRHDAIMPTAFATFSLGISCSVKHTVADGAQGAGQSKGGFTHESSPSNCDEIIQMMRSHIITASFYRHHILLHTRSNRVHLCTHSSLNRTELELFPLRSLPHVTSTQTAVHVLKCTAGPLKKQSHLAKTTLWVLLSAASLVIRWVIAHQ